MASIMDVLVTGTAGFIGSSARRQPSMELPA